MKLARRSPTPAQQRSRQRWQLVGRRYQALTFSIFAVPLALLAWILTHAGDAPAAAGVVVVVYVYVALGVLARRLNQVRAAARRLSPDQLDPAPDVALTVGARAERPRPQLRRSPDSTGDAFGDVFGGRRGLDEQRA